MGKPESWGVCESALKPRGVWEGSWRIGQGSKPDLVKFGRPGLSGASGNVARVELCTHLAYRKGEDGNPPPVHRRARALSQQPISETWDDIGLWFPFSPHGQEKMIAHAAKSNRKSMQRLLCSIVAPGTIRKSAEQVPIPRYSESRSFRCECYGCTVLREFGFCPGHIGKEQPANILQTLLDKLFDLLESSVEQS